MVWQGTQFPFASGTKPGLQTQALLAERSAFARQDWQLLFAPPKQVRQLKWQFKHAPVVLMYLVVESQMQIPSNLSVAPLMHSRQDVGAVPEQNLQEKWQAWQFPRESMKNFWLQMHEPIEMPVNAALALQDRQLLLVNPLQVLQLTSHSSHLPVDWSVKYP